MRSRTYKCSSGISLTLIYSFIYSSSLKFRGLNFAIIIICAFHYSEPSVDNFEFFSYSISTGSKIPKIRSNIHNPWLMPLSLSLSPDYVNCTFRQLHSHFIIRAFRSTIDGGSLGRYSAVSCGCVSVLSGNRFESTVLTSEKNSGLD